MRAGSAYISNYPALFFSLEIRRQPFLTYLLKEGVHYSIECEKVKVNPCGELEKYYN